MRASVRLVDRLHEGVFNSLYSRSLVYNTCWEDPAVDRRALELGPDDRMLVITSAGCNVLDYALLAPARIHAVDANPRQTALLELKLAGLRRLSFDDFFGIFGAGYHAGFRDLYQGHLRDLLSPFARRYWDRRQIWFRQDDQRDTFYYFGLAGIVARIFRGYLRLRPRLRDGVEELLACRDMDTQRDIYERRVDPLLWSPAMNWALSRQLTMSMLGVPHPQRKEVQRQHEAGIAGFIREAVRYVFRHLPVQDNYFWTLYLRGGYTRDCCPEYLKPDNFQRLQEGLVDRIVPHTCTVTDFLRGTEEAISRFVLLDHMDWMSSYYPDALAEEWQAIFERATAGARVLFRSAHAEPAYLDTVQVPGFGPLRERVHFDRELAAHLHPFDRVHTYAGFHIALPRL